MIEISKLGEVVTGSTPKAANKNAFGGEIPFVTPSDLDQDGVILSTQRQVTEIGAKECKLLPKNSILVSCIGTLGKVSIAGKELATNQQINAIVFDEEKIFPKYGFYSCRRLKPIMDLVAPSTTLPILNKTKFSGLKIPLPSLPEQKRIAAILDQADALRKHRQRALDHLNQLGQSIFYEMFGDPNTWKNRKRVSEVANLINGDRSSKYPSGNDILSSGILFLSSKNIINSELVLDECNFISQQKFDSLSRGKLKRNDLVVTLRGSIGQCAEFDCEYDTGFINAQMMIVRPNAELLSSVYFRELFTHPLTQAGLTKNQSGSAVPQLTGKQISDLEVPIPEMSKQLEFSKLISKIKKDKNRLLAAQKQTETLFSSLQQRAFKGGL